MEEYCVIEDAIMLAVEKFRGVRDKGGQPYVLHLLRVMLKQTDSVAQQTGVLHDLVEDTDVSLEELRMRKFSPEVLAAIDAMTHRADMSYADYAVNLKRNESARKVKLADLDDNYRLDRVAYREGSESEDSQRLAKYILTFQFLSNQLDETTYKQRMARLESS